MSSRNLRKIENFINGKFFQTEKYIDSYDPSTGEVWAKVPDSGKKEVDEAVAAAKKAFETWSTTPVTERVKILLRIADIIESKADELAIAESRDQGKPVWLAKSADMNRCVTNFRQFAISVQNDSDISTQQPENGVLNYTIHAPVGVAGIIVPWNFPLYLLTFKIAPALAYGNTVVAKPSEFTSVTAWMFCSILQDAGLPAGVVNMVFGYGHTVGQALITHPDVPLISFTGSTKTGTHIQQCVASQAKKVSLENAPPPSWTSILFNRYVYKILFAVKEICVFSRMLLHPRGLPFCSIDMFCKMGGKNAAIVFDDADLKNCMETLIKASFINQGQVCLSTSRIYVQDKIFETFKTKFTELVKNIKVGAPDVPNIFMGPLNNEQQWNKVKNYLQIAREEGASFLCGDQQDNLNLPPENKKGYFLAPTVLTDLSSNSKCMQEEIFGPVTCITPFQTEEEAIKLANGVNYGLCASLWSQNIGRIHRIAHKLEVGTVWCNCWLIRDLQMPFGGMKMSGIGREGTIDSREFYTEKKTICIKYD